MEDQTSTSTDADATANTPAIATQRRSGSRLAWFLVLVLVVALGAAVFWFVLRPHPKAHDYGPDIQHLSQQLDALSQDVAGLKDRDNTLGARLDDGDQVDKSMRAQLLSLNERAQNLEDSVAKLAVRRLSGRESMALDETELLLTLGTERFRLFHDVPGTIAAYHAADGALDKVNDPTFSAVRESIHAEINALNDLHASDPMPLIARLDPLRAGIARLPPRQQQVAQAGEPKNTSRLWRVLGSLVQVRHEDKQHAQLQMHDVQLSRDLVSLDLRDAQAAALARDQDRYLASMKAAREQIRRAFDPAATAVEHTIKVIDELSKAELAPQPPQILGSALKQLRDLRTTHALRTRTPSAEQSAAEPSDSQR